MHSNSGPHRVHLHLICAVGVDLQCSHHEMRLLHSLTVHLFQSCKRCAYMKLQWMSKKCRGLYWVDVSMHEKGYSDRRVHKRYLHSLFLCQRVPLGHQLLHADPITDGKATGLERSVPYPEHMYIGRIPARVAILDPSGNSVLQLVNYSCLAAQEAQPLIVLYLHQAECKVKYHCSGSGPHFEQVSSHATGLALLRMQVGCLSGRALPDCRCSFHKGGRAAWKQPVSMCA